MKLLGSNKLVNSLTEVHNYIIKHNIHNENIYVNIFMENNNVSLEREKIIPLNSTNIIHMGGDKCYNNSKEFNEFDRKNLIKIFMPISETRDILIGKICVDN